MAKPKYKSGLEERVAKLLPKPVKYEPIQLPYHVVHHYYPDFEIAKNKYIEVKGKWVASDRAKHKYIKQQQPHIRVYFVFGNAANKLNKASKTTYGEWATKNGFLWVDIKDFTPDVVKEWIKE